jgi:hypothetical protein
MFEERRIDCRRKQCRQAYPTSLFSELGANRLAKATYSMLGAGVGGHQWHSVVGDRRAHIDDDAAVARQHALQRYACAIDGTQISDIGYTPKLVGRGVEESTESRVPRAIHPHIDRAKLPLELRSGSFQSRKLRDVRLNCDGRSATARDIGGRRLQPDFAPRDQPNPPAFLSKEFGGAAPNPR